MAASDLNSADILAAGGATFPMSRMRGLFSVIGDSIQTNLGRGDVGRKIAGYSGGRHRTHVGLNFAVGGTKLSEIAATVPTAIATGARRCTVNGGTNDFIANVPVADMRTTFATIMRQLAMAGVEPISIGMCPSQVATQAIQHANFELWKQLFCMANGFAHTSVWPLLAAPSGAWATGYRQDNYHPSSVGIDVMAMEAIKTLDNLSYAPGFLALLDENVSNAIGGVALRNAVSFGGVGSALPSAWFALGSGVASYAVEAPTDGSFGNWLTANFNGPATAAGFNGTAFNPTSFGWEVGDRIAVGCRVRATGTTPPAVDGTGMSANTVFGSMRVTVNVGGSFSANNSFLCSDFDAGSGMDQVLYTEMVLNNVSAGTFRVTATTTGTNAQKLSIQRPVMFNMTKAGLA